MLVDRDAQATRMCDEDLRLRRELTDGEADSGGAEESEGEAAERRVQSGCLTPNQRNMMLVRMGGTFYWNTFWHLLRKISHNESLELTSYHCHRGVIRHRWITFTAQWRDEHTLIIDRPLSGLDSSMGDQ